MNLKISLLLVLLLCGTLQATTIAFYSGDGVNEYNYHNLLVGNNVLINPNPVWATIPGALWVSDADSGTPGTVSPPNAAIPGPPTTSFFEVLPLGTYFLTLNILADDTASVFLEDATNPFGLLLKAANPNQDGHCADDPIACEVGENWLGSSAVDPSGFARLRIEAYQRGGGAFGTDYAGTASTVPEPAGYLLLGTGLVLLGGIWKLRMRSR